MTVALLTTLQPSGIDVGTGEEDRQTMKQRTEERYAVTLEPVRGAVEHHRLVAVVEQQRLDQVERERPLLAISVSLVAADQSGVSSDGQPLAGRRSDADWPPSLGMGVFG